MITEMSRCVVVVDVGGTTIKSSAVQESGAQLWTSRTPTPSNDPAATRDAVLHAVEKAVAAASAHGETPSAVGLSVLGLVDEPAGVARFSAAVGWRDVPLRELVVERTGLPTALVQDIRAGLLAELTVGAAVGRQSVLYVALGTGLGAAFALDDRILRGQHGNAGELGHVTVADNDRRCGCGRTGCLETEASATGISTTYLEHTGIKADAHEIARRARDGDAAAATAWLRAAKALGAGLATASALLDPELIVLAGGVSLGGDLLLDPTRRALAEDYVLASPPPVALTTLGDAGPLIGAAVACRQLLATIAYDRT